MLRNSVWFIWGSVTACLVTYLGAWMTTYCYVYPWSVPIGWT